LEPGHLFEQEHSGCVGDDLFEISEDYSTESYSSQAWSVRWRLQLFWRCEGQELYTAVAYNADDMVCLKNKIADLVSTVGYNSHCSVSCEEVLFAVCKLKPGKDDGDIGLSSDYFLNACNELSVHISMLFTCLLVHGVAPQMMNLSTVVPIPKGKNVCLSNSSNYRGIALSSIFGKLFDIVVLNRFHDQLCVSDPAVWVSQ